MSLVLLFAWTMSHALWLTTGSFKIMPEPKEYILDFPTTNNPLNISVATPLDRNYFMIIGDWGAVSDTDKEVQEAVAQKMIDLYETRKENGYNLLFVATVGDNFYYDGQDCSTYEDRWKTMYQDLATDYHWLAVFGNHDWGKSDPDAICAWGSDDIKYVDPTTNIPYAANQINEEKKGCNPSLYYLPDFGYYYRIDELSFEAIFLEESVTICPGDMGEQTYKSCNDSSKIGCEYLGRMATASEDMLLERAKESENKNFVIMQHYPDNSDRLLSLFEDNRENNDDDIVWSLFGHDHRQYCEKYDSDNESICKSILTGGGGGCCEERTLRGFFVIDFDSDGHMTQTFKYDDEEISCEYPCKKDFNKLLTKKQIKQSRFEHCCYAYSGEDMNGQCDMFDLSKC